MEEYFKELESISKKPYKDCSQYEANAPEFCRCMGFEPLSPDFKSSYSGEQDTAEDITDVMTVEDLNVQVLLLHDICAEMQEDIFELLMKVRELKWENNRIRRSIPYRWFNK